jgi:hypothetical protein
VVSVLPVATLFKSQHSKEGRWNLFFCLKSSPKLFQLAGKYWYKHYHCNLLLSEFRVSHEVALLTVFKETIPLSGNEVQKGLSLLIEHFFKCICMNYNYICSFHRALTAVTYCEGCVTAPYAPPVKLFGNTVYARI